MTPSRRLRHTLARTLDFGGRATRIELFGFLVASQIVGAVVTALASWAAPEPIARWVAFAVSFAVLIPAPALLARRFHDFGWSARWGGVLLAIAAENLAYGLMHLLFGWNVRAAVEGVLAYVDWVLFLPATVLFVMLLAMPGSKGANRFGPDPRYPATQPPPARETAGAEGSAPAV